MLWVDSEMITLTCPLRNFQRSLRFGVSTSLEILLAVRQKHDGGLRCSDHHAERDEYVLITLRVMS